MPMRHRGRLGKPRFHLATRPLLAQQQGSTPILADDVERILTDIDANHAGDRTITLAGHGELLLFAAPCQRRSLAGKLGEAHGELIEITTYLTQDELAQMVMARRERVSTALNILRQRGVVKYSPRGRLRVDMRALTK